MHRARGSLCVRTGVVKTGPATRAIRVFPVRIAKGVMEAEWQPDPSDRAGLVSDRSFVGSLGMTPPPTSGLRPSPGLSVRKRRRTERESALASAGSEGSASILMSPC